MEFHITSFCCTSHLGSILMLESKRKFTEGNFAWRSSGEIPSRYFPLDNPLYDNKSISSAPAISTHRMLIWTLFSSLSYWHEHFGLLVYRPMNFDLPSRTTQQTSKTITIKMRTNHSHSTISLGTLQPRICCLSVLVTYPFCNEVEVQPTR
jgi:hypothetical protein